METLSNVLYWLSTGLFVPVMLGTVIMFIYALVLSGSFYTANKEFLVYKKSLREHIRKPNTGKLAQLAGESKSEVSSYIADILQHQTSVAAMERVLSDFELAADKNLGRYKLLAKLGPILGLMGTLIPMGPALAGLGSGDVSSMSWNMQVAFSTTVIGLFAGTIGFLILQPKQRIYMHYLGDLEYLVSHIGEQGKRKDSHHHHTPEMALTDTIETL